MNIFRLLVVSLFISTKILAQVTVISPFTERKVWDGPYEIKMVAAPAIESAYVNPQAATQHKVQVDSIISCATIMHTGNLIDHNNQYQGWPPNEVNIPLSTILCPEGNTPCPEAYQITTSSTCPEGKFNSILYEKKMVYLAYADYDTDLSTFSSSRASFNTSGCNVQIEEAYLYWFGQRPQSSDPDLTIASPTASYNGSPDVARVNPASFKTVKFKSPGEVNYTNITALNTYDAGNNNKYVCIANVTAQIKGKGQGDIWVGNVQSYLGRSSGGSYAGWALVIIYSSPDAAPRRISLWDGLIDLDKEASSAITLTGLVTPSTNDFKSYIGYACLDGENFATRVDNPEFLEFKTNNGGANIAINPFLDRPYPAFSSKGLPANASGSDAVDACKIPDFTKQALLYDGISSSHITSYNEITNTNGNEIDRTPSCTNTIGIDVHHLLLPDNAIATGATQASLKFYAGEQGGTSPFLAYIAIETLQPKLELSKTANTSAASLEEIVNYKLTVKNTGGLASLGGTADYLIDTLDSGVSYVPNSSNISGTIVSSGLPQILKIPLPKISVDDSLNISFDVKIKDISFNDLWFNQCKREIINVAWSQYMTSDGRIFKNASNATDCDFGTATRIKIVDESLGVKSKITIGPIDLSTYSEYTIIPHLKQELINYGVAISIIDEFDLFYYPSFKGIRNADMFDITLAEQRFLAVRTIGALGQCEETYEIIYVLNSDPEFVKDSTNVTCYGYIDGSIGINAIFKAQGASIAYSLYKGSVTNESEIAQATLLQEQALSTKTDFTATNLPFGSYTLVAKNTAGKLYFIHYNIDQPTEIVTTIVGTSVCSGDNTELKIATISGGPNEGDYSFVWQKSTDAIAWQTLTQTTENINPVITENSYFRLLVNKKNCVDTAQTNIIAKPLPKFSIGNDTSICANQTLQLQAIDNMDSYIWSNGNTTRETIANVSGTYSVTVSLDGCQYADTVEVTIKPMPTLALDSLAAFCNKGEISAISDADHFLWNNAVNTSSITVNKSGKYIVTVTKDGCSATDSIMVTVYYTPEFSIGNDTSICNGSSLILNAFSGADTYLWNTGETTQEIEVSQSGIYTVSISLGTCNTTATRKISINSTPDIEISGIFSVCPGESTTLTASGAEQYLWQSGETEASITIQPNKDTIYTLTGFQNGCRAISSATIIVKPLPIVNASANHTICYGESTTISVSGNAQQWLWSSNLGTTATVSVAPIATTSYYVTGTLNNCTATDSVKISVNPQIIISPGADTSICLGSTILLQSDGNAIQYQWDNGLGIGASHQITPLQTTKYAVTAVYNGCTVTDEILVTVNNLPTVAALASKTELCIGDSSLLSATGAVSYLWSNLETTNHYINPNQTQTYWVTGTDINSCSNTAEIEIIVHELPQPQIEKNIVNNSACIGDTVSLWVSNYQSYLWSTNQTSSSIEINQIGTQTFWVNVSDENACKNSDTITITIYDNPKLDLGNDTLLCINETWEKDIYLQGATYLWSNNSTSSMYVVKPAGGIVWAEVSLNGCTTRDSVEILFTELPNYEILGDTIIYQGDTTWFKVSKTFASYLWNTKEHQQMIRAVASVIAPAQVNYWVMVTDEYSCKKADTVKLTVIEPLQLSLNNVAFCSGSSAELIANAGFDTYEWSDGSIKKSITVKEEGIYVIKAHKYYPPLTLIDTVRVRVHSLPEFDLGNNITICKGESVSLSIQNQNYSYLWNNGQTGNAIEVTQTGNYILTITTDQQCSYTDAVQVLVKPLPNAPISANYVFCRGTGLQTVEVEGFNLSWYIDNQTAPIHQGNTISNLTDSEKTLNYQVTQNIDGCQSTASPISIKIVEPVGNISIIGDSLFCIPQINAPFLVNTAFEKIEWNITGGHIYYTTKKENEANEKLIYVDFSTEGIDTIYVWGTDINGCRQTDSLFVYLGNKPKANFTAEVHSSSGKVSIINESEAFVMPESGEIATNNSFWKFGQSTDESAILNNKQEFSYDYKYGNYTIQLKITNQFGCADSISKSIFVDAFYSFYAPNALSPNNATELVRIFKPTGTNIQEFNISVYDKWGNLIWYSDKLHNGAPAESWDATYNGKSIQAGSYIWKAEGVFINGETFSQFGNVMIIK
ncbi:MAG: gliding motility-associated C-terminal domain-containing protein [Bacteroidales bacterium]|nr:gliding motility-associated C-terminal domain-containing protein [Bacteroidales bacterium]